MARQQKENNILFLLLIGLAGWFLPGGGYFLLNKKKHAIVIFATITLTFATGIYAGSIGIIDPFGHLGAKLTYTGQLLTSPLVSLLGYLAAGGAYPVYGRPNEIGQIYTITAGLLNLLCIVNAVYLAHLRQTGKQEG